MLRDGAILHDTTGQQTVRLLPAQAPPPLAIPNHEILRRIGHGSYGEVWLARTVMGTYRAVKTVCRSRFEDAHCVQREIDGIKQFEPISRSHDGFIDVLQVGQQGDHFFYVMELGDDQSMGQEVNPETYIPKTLANEIKRRGRLPVADCVKWGLAVTSALVELHKHGLVHRDIKPSNIIFVKGVPKLADVGLVTGTDKAESLVGTPGFIPPEGPGTPVADVYALGKVLYEMSTGQDRTDFPTLPPELQDLPNDEPFRELNAVMLKACQNDHRRRYESAEGLQGELELLREGKSVRKVRVLERRLTILTKAGIAGGLAFVLALLIQGQISHDRQQVAEARQRETGGLIAEATDAMEQGDLLAALPALVGVLRLDTGDMQREETHRLRLGAVLAQCPKLVREWFHAGRMNYAEFSQDGARVVSAAWFGKAQVWNVNTGLAISPPFGPEGGLEMACFNPDGTLIVTASEDKTVRVWDAASGKEKLRLPHPARTFAARFSPDGCLIVTACDDKYGRLWNAETGKLKCELKGHQGGLLSAAFSKDGRWIVTCGKDKTARLWDAMTGNAMGSGFRHKNWVYDACFSPSGQRVVTACFDRKARVWDISSGREVVAPMPHGDAVRSAEFSPDGEYLVTAGWDSSVRIWDAQTGHAIGLNPVLYHSDRVMRASFSSDGRRIVTVCVDGTTRVWDLGGTAIVPEPMKGIYTGSGARLLMCKGNSVQLLDAASGQPIGSSIPANGQIRQTELSRNGNVVLMVTSSATGGPILQVWEVPNGIPLSPAVPCTDMVVGTSLSADAQRFAWFTTNSAQVCQVRTGRPVSPVVQHHGPITKAFLSPDGVRLLTSGGKTVRVWDAQTGTLLFPPLEHIARVSHAEFSPDSRYLVTCATDDTLNRHSAQVWDAVTGKRVGSPLNHRDGVLYASFSPDSQRVVTASEDFTAIVWDALTGKQLTPALKHADKVLEAKFSCNGRWIVTACEDDTARVWDAITGRPLTPPLTEPSPAAHVRFLANDTGFLAANNTGKAWLWNLPRQTRPVTDLALFAGLLGLPPRYETVMASHVTELERAWKALNSKYPDDFTVSRQEILSWHKRVADECEHNERWFAARFHLNMLAVLQTGDQVLTQRLCRVQQKLDDQR